MKIRRRPPTTPVSVKMLSFQVKLPDAEPQNILEEIVWHKEAEVAQMREALSLLDLRKQVVNAPPPRDFLAALKQAGDRPAIIAEVKKASPSKGVIREDFDPLAIAQAYDHAGAACISVLTDQKFFQGSFDYLAAIRGTVDRPLLCKEFVIYPYQIYLARAKGADAVLLIASILTDQDLAYFLKIVHSLQMAALIEVHTLAELDRVLGLSDVALIGINNRNLEDFSVTLQTTCDLLAARRSQLESRNILVVSESGIHTSADLQVVAEAGAKAVLVGESLMKQTDPGQALTALRM